MRNDNCTTCGGFGYTIDTDHTMTGCHECFVAAHEADEADKVLVLGKGNTLIDIRPEPARGVAYTLGGLS